ncbi:MAG: hemerythrin domain-containing protein [Bacteroidota bacterium]
MSGPLYRFFTGDHRRLDELFERTTANPKAYDLEAYAAFRSGLLRHIGLEEKILFPAAQRAHGDKPLQILTKLRLDHGAITALMVPPPSPAIIGALRKILADHDALEESLDGIYELSEKLVGSDAEKLLADVKNAPEVPVLKHRTEAFILDATRRALKRAGYDLDDFGKV